MPDAIITSTESTFGTISGTFAADQSTVTGTVTGIITGTLSGSVGVPGPQGPQGPQGEPGEGVPAGGTAGQFLQKIDGTNYNTDWVTLNLSAYLTKAGNLSGLTSLPTARDNLQLGVDNAPEFNGLTITNGITVDVSDDGNGITFGSRGEQTVPFLGYDSPAFTGNPTAPTAALADNDTSIATTAFVQQELLSGTANARNLEVYVRNQTGSTIPAGSIVYINGATGNRPTITLAQANNDANSAQTFGFTKTAIANNGFGFVIVRGELENINTSALTEGVQLYLSPTTAGTWTTTKPSAPQHLVYVGICVRAHPTQGVILVAIQNGYEINELHDVKITSPTNGQVLKYDSTQSLWVNGTDVGGVAWGTITGTLSSQTDLQSALDGKYSTTNPAGYITSAALTGYATESFVTSQGYITSSALSPYLTSATAASTYQTLSGMSSYLTTSAAAAGYYPLSGNPSGFLTAASLSGYATESWVTAGFYPLASNPAGYLTSSALTGYATESWVTSQGYLTSAPVTSVAGRTGAITLSTSDISGLGTMATASASDYSTTTVANGLYYPLSSNPAGYLTSAPVTSVAGRTGAVTLSNTDISGLGTLSTVNDAPSDGNEYVRKNAAWSVATGGSSYITSVSSPLAVSSGNLTVDLSTKADLNSPSFTGTPSLPTGTTAVTQTLGDNSTKVATTAFVLANGGSPTFASIEDTLGASISNEALSPSSVAYIMALPGAKSMNGMLTFSNVGASSGVSQRGYARVPFVDVAANSRATSASSNFTDDQTYYLSSSSGNPKAINFSKKVAIWGTYMNGITQLGNNFNGTTNNTGRCNIGGRSAFVSGDLTQKGIGWKLQGGGSAQVQLTVHDGTTLTDVASGFTPGTQTCFHYVVFSDGSGNVYLYINGVLKCQTSAGPTGNTTTNYNVYQEQIESGATGSKYVGVFTGSFVYLEP